MNLTQKESDAVGKASEEGHALYVLSDLIKRAHTFTSTSEHLKSSDEVKEDLVKYMEEYLELPSYIDSDDHINIFRRTELCYIRTTVKVGI